MSKLLSIEDIELLVNEPCSMDFLEEVEKCSSSYTGQCTNEPNEHVLRTESYITKNQCHDIDYVAPSPTYTTLDSPENTKGLIDRGVEVEINTTASENHVDPLPTVSLNPEGSTECEVPTQTDFYEDHDIELERILNAPSENLDSNLPIYGDINEGRKRSRKSNPASWKRQKAKLLRMRGQEYIGFSRIDRKINHNQPRKSRQMGPRCNSKMCEKTSKRNCELISEESRKTIFDNFWSELTWDQRKIYIVNHVKKINPLRRYTTSNGDPKRESTLLYHLTVEGKLLTVCKKTFLSNLALGEFTVRSWVNKGNHGMLVKNPSPPKAVSEKRNGLTKFFESLPKLPSHYARKETRKLYLQSDIKSHSQLYEMYIKQCNEQEHPDAICSRKLFDEVLFDENISLYTLKKDKCDLCEGHRVKNVEDAVYQQHLERKERARMEKESDKTLAVDGKCTVLTMDLEALKMAPYLNCSGYYYKTKLSCHNFSIFNLVTNHVKCYWFTECDSEPVASAYASCLIDYLGEHCAGEKNKIIIYSDGCTAQNRNAIMANALLDYAIRHNIEIVQKYLEVGHTQMEVDSVHAAIERRLKNREIYLPREYVAVTQEARIKPYRYDAKLLDYSFFKNYAVLQRYTSIRPGKKKGDPCVTDIRVIMYSPRGHIKVKLSFDEDFADLPHRPKSIESINWPDLYTEQLKINSTKWKHLQELKFALPSDVHQFYDNLPHD